MGGQKDKDYHKLRNPEKYGMEFDGYREQPTKEGAEAKKAYEKLHNKFGGKSMVADKRRRCTTRHSNARMSKVIRRIDRAKGKEQVINLLKTDEELLFD